VPARLDLPFGTVSYRALSHSKQPFSCFPW
jgi:hypothetical protein